MTPHSGPLRAGRYGLSSGKGGGRKTNPRGKEEIQFEVSLEFEDDDEVLGPRSGSSSSAGGVAVGSDVLNVAAGSSAQVAVSPHQKPLVPAQRRQNPHKVLDDIRMPPPPLPPPPFRRHGWKATSPSLTAGLQRRSGGLDVDG